MRARPLLLALGALAVLGLVVFARAAGFAFLSWDDPVHVTANPLLATPSVEALARIWGGPHEGFYIPVTYSVWLGAAAISRDATLFHALNVALHLVNGALVLALLWRVLPGEPRARGFAAACGAALFVVHPLQVEAVAWVSGLRDLLSACGVLVALHLAVAPPTSGRRTAGALAVFALALLSKPSAVSLPLLMAALILGSGEGLRAAIRRALPFVVLVIPAVVIARVFQHRLASDDTSVWLRPLVALDALQFYLIKLVWPAALSPDHGRTTASVLASGALMWTWVLPVSLLALVTYARKRVPSLLTGLLLFIAGLAPTLGLVGFTFQGFSNVADRFAYLALLGPAHVLAALTVRRSRWARGAALAVIAGLTVVCIPTLGAWANDEALFTRTLAVNPSSAMAATNLGVLRHDRGDLEGARILFTRALESRPNYLPAELNLGSTLVAMGRHAEAVAPLQRAIAHAPPSAQLELNLGAALALSGDIDAGVAHYRRALELNPNFAEAYNNLGAVELAYGRNAEAAKLFERAVELAPHDPGFRKNLERARQP